MSTPTAGLALVAIKLAHTAIWAFFVACILAIWGFALQGRYGNAVIMIGIVLLEVIVLGLNGGRCSISSVAGRYTHDRCANFDIYLPAWLARNNKLVFGTLYGAGIALTLTRWSFERV